MQPYTTVSFRHSIATRLLTIVFSIYLIVTFTVTLTHMIAEYYDTKNKIGEDLEIFNKTFAPGLSLSIFNVDDEQAASVIKGMFEIPIIVGVKVEDPEGEVLNSQGTIFNSKGEIVVLDQDGNQIAPQEGDKIIGLFGKNYEMNHVIDEETITNVGKITLYSSAEIVFGKVQYGFIFIIINSIIKTFALWGIFSLTARVRFKYFFHEEFRLCLGFQVMNPTRGLMAWFPNHTFG